MLSKVYTSGVFGIDGYEVTRQVRKKRCNTPILMLTARSGLEDRIQGLNAGADYYLTKPFDIFTVNFPTMQLQLSRL